MKKLALAAITAALASSAFAGAGHSAANYPAATDSTSHQATPLIRQKASPKAVTKADTPDTLAPLQKDIYFGN